MKLAMQVSKSTEQLGPSLLFNELIEAPAVQAITPPQLLGETMTMTSDLCVKEGRVFP